MTLPVTLDAVDLYRYALPLTPPLTLGTSTVRRRTGLLVRLATADGAVGWGEAAPLPGFSTETLSEVVEHARSVRSDWMGVSLPEAADLPRLWRALPQVDDAPASLRFAVESAVVDLRAAADDRSIASVLGGSRSTVALNALIADPLDDGPVQAERLRASGYRAVKVKVGRGAVAAEAECIRAIRRALGDAVALRLDANRAWSMQEAETFAEAVRGVDVAYLEEPLSTPARLDEFAARTGLPVALDETTREEGPEELSERTSVSAVILKPTLLGGLRATLRWMREARRHGITPVLSAAYEAGVGMRMLVALAAAGPDTPVGLSTYDRLAADVLDPRLRMEGPTVEVRAITASGAAVDRVRLDPVP